MSYNWISNWKKIGIKVQQILKKQPVGQQETNWCNCPLCKKISYLPDLIANSYICECSFHFDMPPKFRLDSLFDSGIYETIEAPSNVDSDVLNFVVEGRYKYSDKIKAYQKKTNQKTALLAGSGLVSGMKAVVTAFHPGFGGGRFGVHENEHFLAIANYAVKNKVDFWLCCYQSSGIDVHGGVTALYGMPKSIMAMNEIKQANIPTFALASRGTAGGTYASSFFLHEILLVEPTATDILFSGKRVTSNILKSTDAIPDSFGTGIGIHKAGLCDYILNNRKELKNIITTLASIILKRKELKISDEEANENRETSSKTDFAS